MRYRSLIPAAVAFIATALMMAACQARPEQQSTYSISVDGDGNRVVPHEAESETVFDVTSETGIGSADVKQTAGGSPAVMLIRLHLKGLEEFAFEYGETVVTVSVSSHGDQMVSESMSTAGADEFPIGAESPYSMPVRAVNGAGSGGGSATGYFEVQAPQDYIQGGYRAFSMRWIDFYR
jgi:predicted phage tail protein